MSIVIEYFGYGASDTTSVSRSNQTFVHEIRDALRALDIAPPYILMPHSMSGLYALCYSQNFCDELEAVIGIDASLPQKQLERWTRMSFEDAKLYPELIDLNLSVINQWNSFYDNSHELTEAKFPNDLPVLLFLSSEQVDSVNAMIKENKMQTHWEQINKNIITNPKLQKTIMLDGEHYLHHTQADKIYDMSKSFLTKLHLVP